MPQEKKKKKEETVNITSVSLKVTGVRVTDFTKLPLDLTCKRTPHPFPRSKGTDLQHCLLPPVSHTSLPFCAATVGMIHLRFVLNIKLFTFFPFF